MAAPCQGLAATIYICVCLRHYEDHDQLPPGFASGARRVPSVPKEIDSWPYYSNGELLNLEGHLVEGSNRFNLLGLYFVKYIFYYH